MVRCRLQHSEGAPRRTFRSAHIGVCDVREAAARERVASTAGNRPLFYFRFGERCFAESQPHSRVHIRKGPPAERHPVQTCRVWPGGLRVPFSSEPGRSAGPELARDQVCPCESGPSSAFPIEVERCFYNSPFSVGHHLENT